MHETGPDAVPPWRSGPPPGALARRTAPPPTRSPRRLFHPLAAPAHGDADTARRPRVSAAPDSTTHGNFPTHLAILARAIPPSPRSTISVPLILAARQC